MFLELSLQQGDSTSISHILLQTILILFHGGSWVFPELSLQQGDSCSVSSILLHTIFHRDSWVFPELSSAGRLETQFNFPHSVADYIPRGLLEEGAGTDYDYDYDYEESDTEDPTGN